MTMGAHPGKGASPPKPSPSGRGLGEGETLCASQRHMKTANPTVIPAKAGIHTPPYRHAGV